MARVPQHGSSGKGSVPSITLPQTSLEAAGVQGVVTQGGAAFAAPGAFSGADTVIEDYQKQVFGSEDTLTVNFYLEVGASQVDFEDLCLFLEEQRERARGDAASGYRAVFELGGRKWSIRSRGVSIGGATGIFMSYVLESAGVTFYLAASRYPSGYNFNGRCTVGSELLMQGDGVARLYPAIVNCWKALGCRVLDERVARVDLAIEAPVSVEEFGSRLEKGGLITRFKHVAEHRGPGRVLQGVQCGRGDVVFRAYDKLAELDDSKDDGKRQVMRERRVGWSDDECTRFEWQLRGAVLKKWDCLTVADWLRLRGPIMEYLLLQHTRLADKCEDRTHTSRARVSDLWVFVLDAFRAVCSGGRSVQPVEKVERSGARVEGLVRQALGCLVSAVALEQTSQGGEDLDLTGVLEGFVRLLDMGMADADVMGTLEKRLRHYATVKPSLSEFWSPDGPDEILC